MLDYNAVAYLQVTSVIQYTELRLIGTPIKPGKSVNLGVSCVVGRHARGREDE